MTDFVADVSRTETIDLIEKARQLALDMAAIGIPVLPLFEKINKGTQYTNWRESKSLAPLPGAEATTDVEKINNWFEALVSVRDRVAAAREEISWIRAMQKK